MKNKIFDKDLYFEGLRQNKVAGIISIVIIFIITALVPIGDLVQTVGRVYYVSKVSFVSATAILWTLIYLITPIMTIHLFGFLNKRNKSDFYHSIPQTRKCLFLSFYASIVTWITAIILAAMASASVFYAVAPTLSLTLKTFFPTVFFFFVASLLVLSALVLAMSVTGRTISGIAVAILILSLPSLLYYVFISSVGIKLGSVLVPGKFGNLFGAKMNVVVNILAVINGLASYDGINGSGILTACAYTLGIAVIYGIVGMLIFSRRKSETAGKAAPSQKWQNLFRIIFGFICSLLPLEIIYFVIYLNGPSGDLITTAYIVIVMYVFVVIGYILYEIITTGGAKGLKKAFSGLLILLGINVATIGCMIITTEVILNFKPDADAITSVSIISPLETRYGDAVESLFYYSYGSDDYFSLKAKTVDFTNDEIKNAVSEQLREIHDNFHTDGENFDKSDIYGAYYNVKIKSGIKTAYRKLRLPNSLIEQIHADTRYSSIYTDLPEYSDNSIKLSIKGGIADYSYLRVNGYENFSKESMIALYEEYRNYLKKADFETVYECLLKNKGGQSRYLQVDVVKGSVTGSFRLPLEGDPAYPPYAKYAELCSKENPSILQHLLESPNENNEPANIQLFVQSGDRLHMKTISLYKDIDWMMMKSKIKEIADKGCTDYSNFLSIQFYEYSNDFSDNEVYFCYLPISKEDLKGYFSKFIADDNAPYYDCEDSEAKITLQNYISAKQESDDDCKNYLFPGVDDSDVDIVDFIDSEYVVQELSKSDVAENLNYDLNINESDDYRVFKLWENGDYNAYHPVFYFYIAYDSTGSSWLIKDISVFSSVSISAI